MLMKVDGITWGCSLSSSNESITYSVSFSILLDYPGTPCALPWVGVAAGMSINVNLDGDSKTCTCPFWIRLGPPANSHGSPKWPSGGTLRSLLFLDGVGLMREIEAGLSPTLWASLNFLSFLFPPPCRPCVLFTYLCRLGIRSVCVTFFSRPTWPSSQN